MCKNNAIGQFDRYGREGVNKIFVIKTNVRNIEKVQRGIQGEKTSKDMASSWNLK